MTPLVLAMVVIALSGAVSWLRFRDALFPPVIHAAAWGAVLLAHFLAGDRTLALPPILYAIITAGVATFAAGAWIATHAHEVDGDAAGWRSPRSTAKSHADAEFNTHPESHARAESSGRPESRAHREASPRRWIGSALLATSIAGLPFFLLHVIELSTLGPTENFFANVRLVVGGDVFSGLEAVGSFGLLAYLVPLSLVSAGYEFFLAPPGRQRPRYWLAVLVALAYAILATGRTYAFFAILLVFGLELVTRRASVTRGALGIGALGVVSFVGLAVLLDRLAGTGIMAAGEMLFSYGVSGTAAFGLHIQQHQALEWGLNVFRTPLAVLASVGFDMPVVSVVKEYSYVPDPTNVYTVFLPYFDDFGWTGVVVAPFMLGLLHGFVYRRATAHSATPFWMLAYALLLYPLLMQGFQEQYFTLLSVWVQLFVLAAAGFLFTARRLQRPGAVQGEPA